MALRDPFVVAGREFGSRLLTGTGKYASFETMREALAASGSEIVTVAVRRIDPEAVDGDITDFLPDARRGSRVRAAFPTGSSSR